MIKINKFFLLTIIINILTFITTIYFIYNLLLLKNIENIIRIIIIIFIIIIYLLFTLFLIKYKKKNKYLIIFSIIFIIYALIIYFISFNIHKVYKTIDSITTSYTSQTFSIVSLSSNETSDLNIGKIGILINEENHNKLIEENQIKKENIVIMDSYIDLLNGLYSKNINYAILPSNYVSLFQNLDSFSNIASDTKIIYTKEIKLENDTSNQDINKPFTILLMGVDSKEENIKVGSANGDALMLITFNPNTLSTTILSIPRDTYTPISCFKDNRKNKITHAAWNGDDCMIKTIENLFDIDINYYFKVNFKGVVKAIDTLGGIEAYVPISFCESDSNRNLDNLVCLSEGKRILNGEEVLALARHRKTINDIKRGENQQYIIEGLVSKLKKINSLDTIYNLLDTISNNMETNMQTDEILSLYNILKRAINKDINIQKLSIGGYDAYIYDYSMLNGQGTKLTLYNFIPYTNSIRDAINAMKNNLNLDSIELSSKEVYILPNFIGDMEETAINYGKNHNLKVNVNYVSSSNQNYKVGEIISQDIKEGMDLSYIPSDGLTIEVINKINVPIKINCSKEENKDNKACFIPNFAGKKYTDFNTWLKNNNYSFRTDIKEIKKGDKDYIESKKGLIVNQNITDISIYDLIGKKLKITYISEK